MESAFWAHPIDRSPLALCSPKGPSIITAHAQILKQGCGTFLKAQTIYLYVVASTIYTLISFARRTSAHSPNPSKTPTARRPRQVNRSRGIHRLLHLGRKARDSFHLAGRATSKDPGPSFGVGHCCGGVYRMELTGNYKQNIVLVVDGIALLLGDSRDLAL